MSGEAGAAPIPAPRDGAEFVGGAAPGPGCREAPACGRRSEARVAVSVGGGVVFADFGKGKVYALTADSEDALIFDNFEDMVDRLSPAVIVVDSLPNRFQKTAAEIARAGIVFLRMRNLEKLSEERKNNGIRKTDENDVRLLKTLYHRRPDLFQPLFTVPEELEVRALTELWVEMAGQKKTAKHTRTTTNNQVAIKAHKTLRLLVDELSKEIHEKALRMPMYRKAVEELGLRGPTLAYIVSHDSAALKTLPRDRLEARYALIKRRRRGRPLRSRLLISLARTAVLNDHPKYRMVYNYYYEKFRDRQRRHWKAVLRVARTILRDLRQLKEDRQQAQEAGPPA